MQPSDQICDLEAAIGVLESHRHELGDSVVEIAVKPLREQLAALKATPDERKRVTILFADVSGFTALCENLDPEDVTTVMNRCFEVLTSGILRYGGTIDKYSGDAVMALFGAPRALENHEEMAVRAALDMQDALTAFSRELEREWGFALRMRIGLNTGTVLAGLVGGLGYQDYTVMGDAVNLASRLEHACPVGRAMISAVTARPLHAVFDLEPPQQMTVRGKTGPITVYLVVGVKAERGSVRGLAGLLAPMIGRDEELAALQALYEQSLSQGWWRAAVVMGEAGVGKTRLRREFLAWTARLYPATRVIAAHCYIHTQAIPYYPLGELVQALFGVDRDDAAATIVAKLAKGLKTLNQDLDETELSYRLGSLAGILGLPLEDDMLRRLEPQQRRARVFLTLERILAEAVTRSPTIVVTEDLHWADEVSLSFLTQFMQAVRQRPHGDQPALLLVICRAPDDSQMLLRQFLAQMEPPSQRVFSLSSLNETQSGRLVAELLRQAEIPFDLSALIITRSQGNPFFVEELIRSLIEDGTLVYDEQRRAWAATRVTVDIQVPDNVQGVLAARLDRLPLEDKQVVQQAAIFGRTFWQRLLAEIAGRPVNAPLSELEERQMVMRSAESQIADDWEWLFRHVLVQQAAYATVTKAMRRRIHRKIAEWLEAHAGDRAESFVPLIAYHYEEAQVSGKALHYLTLATEQAAAAFANQRAVEFSTRALRLATGDSVRFDLYSARHRSYGQLGMRDAQWTDLQEMLSLAESLGDGRRRAQTLNNMGLVVRRQRNLSRASAYHEQALALFQQVEDRVGEERCLNNIGNIHWLRGETEKAMAWYEMALALARQVGERRDEGNCLNNLGAVHWQVGDYSRALRFYQQALLVHQETKDRYNEGIGRSNIGEVRRCLGEFDQAAGDLEGGLAICDAIGDREGKLYVLHLLGLTYTDLGRFDEALLRHQQELYLAQRVADRAAEATAQYGMGLACLGSGSIAEALSWLGRARALHEELGQQDELNADLCALSRVYLISGDVPTARICSSQAIALLGKVSADAQIAVRTDYIHYRAMAAQGESMETVRNYLEQAYHLLAEQARRISDAEDRRSFLRNVPLHREIALEATAHSIAKDEVAQLE